MRELCFAFAWVLATAALLGAAAPPSTYTRASMSTQFQSFLELEAELEMLEQKKKEDKKIPEQESFLCQCHCGHDVTFFPHLLLPFDRIFGCAATKVLIRQVESGWEIKDGEDSYGRPMQYKAPYGMNSAQVQRAMGNPLQQKWAKASIHHISDYSGRAEAPIIGTPGGDIAQFVVALNVFMEMTDVQLENSDCQNLMEGYLKEVTKASFYYPTELKAIEMIADSLGVGSLDLTQTPEEANHDKLLNMLVHPLYQGSNVLRMMLQRPEVFRLRPAKNTNLAQCAIRAFFSILWDKDNPVTEKMRLVEMEGDSDERAIVKIFASLPCEAMGMMPLITPKSDKVCDDNGCKKQMWLMHPQAPLIMHEEMSDFFAEQDAKVNAEEMRKLLKQDTRRIEDLAVSSVLYPTDRKKIPVYHVNFK